MANVKNLLETWGMPQYSSVFEDNDIDMEAFVLLDEKTVDILIPSPGTRLKFWSRWQKFKESLATSSTTESHTAGISEPIPPELPSFSGNPETNPPSTSEDIFPNTNNIQVRGLYTPNIANNSNNVPVSDLDDLESILQLPNSSSETDSNRNVLDSLASGTTVEIQEVLQLSDLLTTQAQAIDRPTKIRIGETVDAQALKVLLDSTPMGKIALAAFTKTGTLDSKTRSYVVNEIIVSEVDNRVDANITTSRFEQLSRAIVALFPTEIQGAYYTPYKKLQNGKKVTAKGKLFNHYHYVRKLLREQHLIDAKRRKRSDGHGETNGSNGSEPLEDVSDKLRWLQNSVDPVHTLEEYWTLTSAARILKLKEAIEPGQRVSQYYTQYPGLQKERGHVLIDIDFRCMFPGKELKLYAEWPACGNKIVSYCRKLPKKSVTIKDILSQIDDNDLNADDTALLALQLLPQILNNHTAVVAGKGKNAWRPSRQETSEGFIYLAESCGDLDNVVKIKKEKLLKYQLPLQPFVFVAGRSLADIDGAYVVIDSVTYRLESVFKAVDICFKAFHALHAAYPAESYSVWFFLQKAIYDITTIWDRPAINVNTLMSSL